ncbi:MAG: glycosyltransferase [Deltaproteobacteria bacterium]|nr:glycosyltransferase [Deltaproteobacteria bacterium]
MRQTVDGLIFQTYPNVEYIFVDGGSTDNTVTIIKEYEESILIVERLKR